MPCSHLPPSNVLDPLRVEDAHLTETVLLLARGIAADLGFDRLPILADALEDAGCDNSALLHHLRSDESHCVECWALRRLLRTTLMLPGNVPITFAYCPPGTFLMGSDHPYAKEWDDERPVHRVTLTTGFYAGIHPVTQLQWRAVKGTEPSDDAGDHLPVEMVSWDDATQFCARASQQTGCHLRLPTEAEWEYACRAGTTTEFHFGDLLGTSHMNCELQRTPVEPGEVAGYDGTTPAGTFPANPWGLFDCHGNVWEWCQEWYDESYYASSPITDPTGPAASSYRVCRGGAWNRSPDFCRSAIRNWGEQDWRANNLGFRVVFTV